MAKKGGKKKKSDGRRRFAVTGKPGAWVVRNPDGTFKNWISKGRSVPKDRGKKAKTTVRPGYGGQGDQPKR